MVIGAVQTNLALEKPKNADRAGKVHPSYSRKQRLVVFIGVSEGRVVANSLGGQLWSFNKSVKIFL